jgi:hypothetical protein
MEHVISAQWIKHAKEKHGSANETAKEKGNQRSLTDNDLLNILVVIDAYDGLTVQKKLSNKTSIIYSKKMNDGTIEYVERVIETSGKHKPRLVTKTAWVKTPIGAETNLPRVYTPERNSSMAFSNGRINPDSVSKVVDENGEPLVAYHGIADDFSTFDMVKGRMVCGGANIMPVFLRIENPMMLDGYEATPKDIALAKQLGHDGIIIKHGESDDGLSDYVAFTPTQIKSAPLVGAGHQEMHGPS